MHDQGNPPLRYRGRVLAPEHLLQFDRQYRRALAVIDDDIGTGGRHPAFRRLALQFQRQRPGQHGAHDGLKVQALEILEAAHLPEVGQEPLIQSRQEGLVGQVGPGIVRRRGVHLVHQAHAGAPLGEVAAPRQDAQTLATHHPEQRRAA